MPRMIDQIRASKLPSGMMQFAARGALQVPPAENIEILVHLALHNKAFGELARLTLAGWDEKACKVAAADPQTSREVLDYFIAPENCRSALLPALLENPSVSESHLVKVALSALRETIEVMLKSARVRSLNSVLEMLKSNPYLRKEDAAQIDQWMSGPAEAPAESEEAAEEAQPQSVTESLDASEPETAAKEDTASSSEPDTKERPTSSTELDAEVFAYLKDHAEEIAAEGEKPFQAIGGIIEILGLDYFPVTQEMEPPVPVAAPAPAATASAAAASKGTPAAALRKKPNPQAEPKRENTLQKINSLDVKGRIQLALKGNKEERAILIRDGTKVVALAVLDAPKLSDGEVEKFASQKNVLEAVLRQIPLKRRFMKNYIVVRNLVANPRTPLDLGLNLMKNLLTQDLKNLSANKEVSETIRKLALKMYKQKIEQANKK